MGLQKTQNKALRAEVRKLRVELQAETARANRYQGGYEGCQKIVSDLREEMKKHQARDAYLKEHGKS